MAYFSATSDVVNVRKKLTQIEKAVQVELKALAKTTAASIRDNAKSRAPVAPAEHRKGFQPGTYRDSIVAEEKGSAMIVYAKIPAALPQNLDMWLEFGTSHSQAQPHILPAAEAAQDPYYTAAENVVRRITDAESD